MSRQSILDRIATMKRLGSRIMRSGYGSLRIDDDVAYLLRLRKNNYL